MTDRLDLPRRYRNQLEALLREHLPDVEVWAYGSRVNGRSHEGSDLDLVLRSPTLEPLEAGYFDLLEAIDNSNIPILVQAHDWARLPESFHQEVEREHVVLVTAVHEGEATETESASTSIHGEMREEWASVQLGEVVDLLTGFPFKSAGYVNHPKAPRLLRGDNIAQGVLRWDGAKRWPREATDNLTRYWLCRGDVVIAMDRPWIEAGLKYSSIRETDLPALLVQRVARLRGGDRLATRFLNYVIGCRDFTEYVLSVQTGTAVPHISARQIRQFEFTLPPLPEQRAIAHILGTLDDKIELNRRMNETLEEMARALFKSWFVDFDPVRAKMDGRWRRGESLPGLPAEYYDLFPDRLVDSELGETPEGWEVTPLSECVEVVRGLSYTGSRLSSDGMPMHNLNSIYEGGGYKHDGLKGYDGEHKPQHVARAGDVIVANTEQGHARLLIGYAAIIPTYFINETLFSHHIYRVRPRDSTALTSNYLCQLLNTRIMHEIVSGFANGTTVNMLPMDALQTPQIVVPARPVLAALNDRADTARRRQEEMIDESRILGTLRDTLLPKLVSGEVRVE